MLPWHSRTSGHHGIRPVTPDRPSSSFVKREAYLVQAFQVSGFMFLVSSYSFRIAEIPRSNLKPETRNSKPATPGRTTLHEIRFTGGENANFDTNIKEMQWIFLRQQIHRHKPFHPGSHVSKNWRRIFGGVGLRKPAGCSNTSIRPSGY